MVSYVYACVRTELHMLRELRESSNKIDDLKRKQLNEELQRWRFYFYFLWVHGLLGNKENECFFFFFLRFPYIPMLQMKLKFLD